MFNFMKRRKPAVESAADLVASQPPGEIFPWPNGAVLTAIDELVLALLVHIRLRIRWSRGRVTTAD